MPRSRSQFATRAATGGIASLAAVTEGLGERSGTLSANLTRFGGVLRAAGFAVTAGRLITAGRAVALLDPERRDDFCAALRACFSTEQAQQPLFDLLFDQYWRADGVGALSVRLGAPATERPPIASGASLGLVALPGRPAAAAEGDSPEATAGAADLLTVKDFADYTDNDIRRARRLARAFAPKLATAFSRRRRIARRGQVDLRRALRGAARQGGDVFALPRNRRRLQRTRLALLCDVSGSMDHYSRHLLQFIFAIQGELRGVSVFVFSTRLHDVTPLLKTRSFDDALARLSHEVDRWSGGTSIGRCLLEFERRHARSRVDSRATVMIISDGWERGDLTELRQAMAGLRRRARRIVWLNPLLGHAAYRPLARGMATALPFVDAFLPAHNLEAIARAVRTFAATPA